MLKYWYDNSSVRVKWNGTVGEYIPVKKGVRQGAVLSPNIFKCCLRFVSPASSTVNFYNDKMEKLRFLKELKRLRPKVEPKNVQELGEAVGGRPPPKPPAFKGAFVQVFCCGGTSLLLITSFGAMVLLSSCV